MPGGDGTGPFGTGGWCTPYRTGAAGVRRYGRGRGFGRGMGMGFGRGMGAGFYGAQPVELTKEDEVSLLEEDAKALEAQLSGIRKRLDELRK